jgi:hypothetical protein
MTFNRSNLCWLALGLITAGYLLFWALLLGATATYSTPESWLQVLMSPEIRHATWLSLVTCSLAAGFALLLAVPPTFAAAAATTKLFSAAPEAEQSAVLVELLRRQREVKEYRRQREEALVAAGHSDSLSGGRVLPDHLLEVGPMVDQVVGERLHLVDRSGPVDPAVLAARVRREADLGPLGFLVARIGACL